MGTRPKEVFLIIKKLRAGVVGLGFIGPQHMDAIRRIPQAELAALCDPNSSALNDACERYAIPKRYTDWHDLIADPGIDVIHNCTPHALHDLINRAAMLAGKHVYAEKPLSSSASAAREMVQLARRCGVAAGVNHQYRLNAAVQEMRARLQKGMAGRPLMLSGWYLQESASRSTDWNHKMDNTGIARTINDVGIHWVDTACYVLGQPVAEVMADLHTHFPLRIGADGTQHVMNTEDTALILLHFADGTPGQFTASKAANGHKNDLQLNVWCDGYGMEWSQEIPDRLVIGRKETGFETLYMNPRNCQPEVLPYVTTPMGHVMGWPEALRNAVQAFYASIADGSFHSGRVSYCTFEDGFHSMAFVEACIRSSEERRWVEVEQL